MKKKILFIIIAVIIPFVTIIYFLPNILGLFSKDISPINDSDLRLKNIFVQESENAYFDLIKLGDVIYYPEEKSGSILDIIAGKTWNEKLVQELISRNTQAFEYFNDAAHKPKFQDPAFADPSKISIDTALPTTKSWYLMPRLSAIRALYLAKQGKGAEALEEALYSARIGQKIHESQAPMIEYLVAIRMKGVSLETIQNIVSTSKLSSAALKRYANELSKVYNNKDGLTIAFKSEYRIQSGYVDLIAKGIDNNEEWPTEINEGIKEHPIDNAKIKSFFYFQPNRTKAVFAEYAKTNIKNVNELCGNIKAAGSQEPAPSSFIKFYVTENAIGKIIHDILYADLTPAIKQKCINGFFTAATQTILAIKAYKIDTDNYPASLNALVPDYLPSVPKDPFDGKPLKYSAGKKIIYSVGEDLQDSGGSNGDNWQKMPDPTFKIGF